MRILFIALISSVIFSSCRLTARTYQASSPMEHVSHIPINTKEKGDIRLEVDFQNYKGNNKGLGLVESMSDIVYINKDVSGCHLSAAVAVTDRIALMGLYRYSSNSFEFSAHTAGGGFNYNLPLKIKREKVRRDFDIFGGIQYRDPRNYMELNGYEYFERIEGKLVYQDTLEKVALANYNIHDRYIRYYIQPSFTLEKQTFSFYMGMVIAYHHQLKMGIQENILRDYMHDLEAKDPLQEYYMNRGNILNTEFFMGIGVGPEICRLNLKHGIGASPVGAVMHIQLGLTSNLNIKKLKEQRSTKKAAKQESLGPL